MTKYSTFSFTVVLIMTLASVAQGIDLSTFDPCPNGGPPAQSAKWPGSNGCGSEWSQFSVWIAKMFTFNIMLTPCCDIHDRCTATCGYPDYEAHFLQCAADFKQCMYELCDEKADLIPRRVPRAIFRAACKSNAYTFAVMVRRLGKGSYVKSQNKYCVCP